MAVTVTMRQIRAKLLQLVQPFVVNITVFADEAFTLWAQWGKNDSLELTDGDEEFTLNKHNLKFVVYRTDSQLYSRREITEREKRPNGENESTTRFRRDSLLACFLPSLKRRHTTAMRGTAVCAMPSENVRGKR